MRLRIHQLDNPLIPIQALEKLHLIDVSSHCLFIDFAIQSDAFERVYLVVGRDDFVNFGGAATPDAVNDCVFEFVTLRTTLATFS